MFYGNRTNTTHTTWQFDRIYTSRYAMEQGLQTDGIAPGRFVLVSYGYDEDLNSIGTISSDYRVAYSDAENQLASPETYDSIVLFTDAQCTKPFIYTTYTPVAAPQATAIGNYYIQHNGIYYKATEFVNGETYYVMSATHALARQNGISQGEIVHRRCNAAISEDVINPEPLKYTDDYYICIGPADEQNPDAALFEPLFLASYQADENSESLLTDYFKRYTFDMKHYKDVDDTWGILYRGYDGTIWEKVVGEGHERFVLIAHTNPITPGIMTVAEPPTNEPIPPFQGADSSDAMYRLHIQTPWGFRIKAAQEDEPSDEEITQVTTFYSQGEAETSSQKVDGAIYYNKQGFKKTTRHFDDETENSIKIEPTGKSSNFTARYKDSQLVKDNIAKTDMQELSISLPALGNAVSDFYDLMYGGTDNPEGTRHLDVEWYSLREQPFIEQGNPTLFSGGKTFDLSTVAGSINTFHNRLGQVIIPINTLPGDKTIEATWGEGAIYQLSSDDGDTFYRKGKRYLYGDPIQRAIDPNPVTLTKDTWEPFTYFLGTTASDPEAMMSQAGYVKEDRQQHFIPTATYYRATVAGGEENAIDYQPITLIPFESNRYWYKKGETYVKDIGTQPRFPEQRYVDIVKTQTHTFNFAYTPNTYYKKDLSTGDYLLAKESVPNLENTYETILETHNMASPFNDGKGWIYAPGVYYYYEDEGIVNPPLQLKREESANPDYGKIYYYLELEEVATPFLTVDGQQVIGYAIKPNGKHTVQFMQANQGKTFYFYDEETENYYKASQSWLAKQPAEFFTSAQSFVELEMKSIMDELFVSGKYYMEDDNETFSLAFDNNFVPGEEYYDLQFIPLDLFYAPNLYYWRENDDAYFMPASEEVMKTYGTYATMDGIYCCEDRIGECPYGYRWTLKNGVIPWSKTFRKRSEYYTAIPIGNINNGEASINGAILTLSRALNLQVEDSRDGTTLVGMLNQAQDILYTLKQQSAAFDRRLNS